MRLIVTLLASLGFVAAPVGVLDGQEARDAVRVAAGAREDVPARELALPGTDDASRSRVLGRPAKLRVSGAPLRVALQELHDASGVSILFSPTLLPDAEVRCECADLSIGEALGILLHDTGLEARVQRDQIFVVPGIRPVRRPAGVPALRVEPVPPVTSRRPAEAVPQLTRSRVLPVVGTITGRVADARTGQPVTSAQVYIDALGIGVLTEQSGRYVLQNVPAGTHTLTAERIGYQTATRQVTVADDETAVVDFEMSQQALLLEEVVATGLVDPVEGVRSPISVASVSREQLAVPAKGSALESLQGQVAGLHMTRMTGQPGEEVSIMLRTPTSATQGGEPLIVVDGVILGAGVGTTNLESADIERIEVIRGAAAASLYGSRAAAGVISIRTQRGQQLPVGRTQFTARTELGLTQAVSGKGLPTHHAYLMNDSRTEYVDFNGNVVDRANRIQPAPTQAIFDKPYPGRVFDNLKNVYRPGNFQTQTFSFAQNEVNTNFQLTLNRYREKGVVVNNDGYTRNSVRINMDHRFLEDFNLGVSAYHSRDTRDNINTSFTDMLRAPPDADLGVKGEDGEYVRVPDPQQPFENPLWTQESRDSERKRARTMASGNLRWEPLPWLSFMANASYDREDEKSQFYLPKGTPLSVTDEIPSDGEIEFEHGLSDTWNAEAQVSLRPDFGALNARTTFRAVQERQREEFTVASGTDFFVTGVPRIDAASTRFSSSMREEIRSTGYLWDTAFEYDEKYILTVLFRRDGSSLFGADNRWHNYYRVAAAYRLAQEDWFDIPNIDELKLSYARGTAGGRPGFEFQYETWTVGQTGVSKGILGNRDLRPEHTTEQEVSLDMILFGRFGVDVTHAWHRTTDQLDFTRTPAYTGYSNQWQNGGVMVGRTTEVTLEAQVFQTPRFGWTTILVGDRSTGRIESWPHCRTVSYRFYCDGIENYTQWAGLYLTHPSQLGEGGDPSLHGPRGPHHGGAVAAAGREDEFEVNDDGYLVWVGPGNHYWEGWEKNLWGTSTTIDGFTYDWGTPIQMMDPNGNRQRAIIGRMPTTSIGWINNFRIGQLTLHLHLHAMLDGTASNDAHRALASSGHAPQVDQAGKPDALKKPLSYYQAQSPPGSSFVQDGAYLKLRTVSASYEIDRQQLDRLGLGGLGMEGVSVGLVARNLFTVTEYDWLDPEVGDLNTRLPSSGGDSDTYPPSRSLTAQLEVRF